MDSKYERKKELILKDAKQVFLNYGYEKTTLDDIARKTGLKKNTLYYYFKSKEELFDEVMSEDMESIVRSISESIVTGKTAEEKVKSYMNALSRAFLTRAQMYTVSAKILLEFMIVLEKSGNVQVEKFITMLTELLKEGVKKGEFVKHDYEEFALVLLEFGMAYNFTFMSKALYNLIDYSELKKEKCCDELFEKGIDYFLKGIKQNKHNAVKKNSAR